MFIVNISIEKIKPYDSVTYSTYKYSDGNYYNHTGIKDKYSYEKYDISKYDINGKYTIDNLYLKITNCRYYGSNYSDWYSEGPLSYYPTLSYDSNTKVLTVYTGTINVVEHGLGDDRTYIANVNSVQYDVEVYLIR